jgi:hypothetical protein
MDRTILPARPPAAQPPNKPAAVEVGGFTVCARGGRVWLHPAGGDGDLEPLEAGELASALQAAAGRAAEQALRERREGGDDRW